MTRTLRFGIVGTGFAGTCTLWHLVHRLTGPQGPDLSRLDATIVTIEQRAVNGPGYPYTTDNVQLAHRCNNQASTMAVHGNDFVEWMAVNARWLVREHPELVLETHPGADLDAWQPDGDEFYPRALFGLYLEHRFQEAVERARAHGIAVESYVRHEVVDGQATVGGFALTVHGLDTGREFVVDRLDRVLLGTGHWQPRPRGAAAGHGGYVASPYPPAAMRVSVTRRLRSRRPGNRRPCVFVQGMGPSGIDAVLSLCGDGEFVHTAEGHVAFYRPPDRPVRVVAGSRSGFFSPVRGPLADLELQHLTEDALAAIRRDNDGYLRINPILDLLDADLRRVTGGAVGWADIENPPYASARDKLADDLRGAAGNAVHSIMLKARRMRFYRQLAPDDKVRYDRLFDTHFIRAAVPMPAANAEKLIALADAGVLSTVRMGYDTLGPVEVSGDGFRVTYLDDGGSPAELHADCVIRATTQDFDVYRHPSPLLQNLLRRGEIVPHAEGGHVTGGIALHLGGYWVARGGGGQVPSPHLASFGAPVRFWQNEHNFAGAFVEAAETVTDDWLEAARAAAAQSAGAAWDLVGTYSAGETTER